MTPAIFDVKTVRVDKRGDIYRAGTGTREIRRAVEKREQSCKQDYIRKAAALDRKFAPEDQHHPFSEAIKKSFHSGGVHPIVLGAFGEANEYTHKLLKLCAKHAAARESNTDISPEAISSARGSPYNVFLVQFRRSLGCLALRTAIEEKLRRVQLIRPSERSAAEAADAGVGNHRSGNGPSWYQNGRNASLFDDFYRYSHSHDNFSFVREPATPCAA